MIMKIRVKIMDQTDHHFEIDDQMLLSDFRLEIAERLHIPPERQRMIFAGHVLKMENNTLSACGLRDGHVVHLVERPADMPFPTQEREPTNVGGHSHFNNSRHGRLLQNIFGTGNGRDRVTYVIPFERNEFLSENSHIEELIQSALDGLPFLTSDQRRRFNYRWESNNILRIALPPQRPHHVASPSLERVALIETLLEQIAHFYRVVEVPGGITDRIDEFLEGSHIYNEENTAVLNEQLRADALSLEREPLTRSRLIDRLDDDERETEESDEHAARFQCVEGLNGSPSYVMRHAITLDLVNILRRLQNENERLHSHLIRFERILNSRILYNINDADHTDSDYRANFFTVYMEHMQRMLHRLSHAWHLTSDLGVYLHNPIPRRLIPNYQNFQLLPPTEGEIVLEFRSSENAHINHATANEPVSRFLDLPPPGSDVEELTSEEIRIIGLNPTVRIMQQMGIAVPIPVTTVGHVNVQSGGSNQPRVVLQRHSLPLHRNSSSTWLRNPISGVDTSTRAESAALSGNSNSFAGQSDLTVSHGAHRGSTDDHISTIEGSSNPPPLPSNTHLSSLEEILIRTIEQSHPSLGSVNPYERIMRFILQSASNPNFDANSLFRSNSVQEAFSSTVARPENTFSSADPSQQSSSSSQIDQDALLSSSGSLARGVITQSGSQMPFMSEVISNIMRNNGISGAVSPQVDVILEYGESVPHSDASQVQSQLFNVSRSGVSTENGSRTHPTAVGYHVEVHQFDVFTQPVESDSNNQTSLQNPISSNTYTPSTSGNYNAHSNTMGSAPARGSLAQSRQRHYGLTNSTPLFMSNMSIPSEMHVSAPRQEVVTVDPFLSCTSRFTDVQRILRNSYPNATTYLSPYRRFMRNTTLSISGFDRRSISVEDYEHIQVRVNSSGDILAIDESNFQSFLRLAVRSALSQMFHTDQDRNAQNARGIAPHVFSVGQSMQTPSGGDVVEATMSTPILVHAEVESHSEAHSDTTSANESVQNSAVITANGTFSEHHYDSIHRDEESRSILTEIANNAAVGFETRLIAILDASRAPVSMLRPGNGAGVLSHLEALLLNFATLADLANMINLNMTPLESHRSRFRAHVIENQLNGNSTPTDEDLSSASERLAALHSSIASVISAAGGEIERVWNGRRMNISRTIRNVEIATIQQLLRAVLNRNISDAEFSRRIQNTLRDYVRRLVALGNLSFATADQSAYVRIAYELLVRAGRSVVNADVNLTRLLQLRTFILPRIAELLRGQGHFPDIDEIPSRLLVWAVMDNCVHTEALIRTDIQSSSNEHHSRNDGHYGVSQVYQDSYDETRIHGTHSNGPVPAKKKKLEDEEPKPSTSRGCLEMTSTTEATGIGEIAVADETHIRDYDGNWQRVFPEWVEAIEWDTLSSQTSLRRLRNLSDMYQMGHSEHARRQIISEQNSVDDLLYLAMQEIIGNVFRGNIPTAIHENISSTAALDSLNGLIDIAIQNRIREDRDYNPEQYPNITAKLYQDHKSL